MGYLTCYIQLHFIIFLVYRSVIKKNLLISHTRGSAISAAIAPPWFFFLFQGSFLDVKPLICDKSWNQNCRERSRKSEHPQYEHLNLVIYFFFSGEWGARKCWWSRMPCIKHLEVGSNFSEWCWEKAALLIWLWPLRSYLKFCILLQKLISQDESAPNSCVSGWERKMNVSLSLFWPLWV